MNNREAINILKRQADGYYPEMTEALNMAIKALSVEPQEWISPTAEPVSTEEAKKLLYQEFKDKMKDGNPRLLVAYEIAMKALEAQTEWIPIKTRPLTKEEKEHYAEMGYSDDSVTFMYDCPLPDDGEEVLVTDWLGNVEFDTFIRDECDGCYFEENCDDGEVVAWKHKPSPYKGDTE